MNTRPRATLRSLLVVDAVLIVSTLAVLAVIVWDLA